MSDARAGMKGTCAQLKKPPPHTVTHGLLHPSWWLPPERGWQWGGRTLSWKGVVRVGVYDGYVRAWRGCKCVYQCVSLCAGVHMSRVREAVCVHVCFKCEGVCVSKNATPRNRLSCTPAWLTRWTAACTSPRVGPRTLKGPQNPSECQSPSWHSPWRPQSITRAAH